MTETRRNDVLARALISGMLCLIAAQVDAQGVVSRDADPRVAWLAEHAVRIRSLDVTDDDFGDLEPLRATLKGVRVVMLGEQSHGDGTTFLAKARLIRFLHEKMDFDVLAFESGLYDCAKAWDLLAGGQAAQEAIPRGVFKIWTASQQVRPVIDYLGKQARSERPLELAGVDCQLTCSASVDFLVPDLAAFLSGMDPKLAEGDEWNRVVSVINHLDDSSWELRKEPVPSSEEQAAFVRTIGRWQSVIAAHSQVAATQPWSGSFWRQLLTSLRVFAEQTWRTDYTAHTGNSAVFAMRDQQMGKNLLWLARERYPNRKIIVWAATFHNARRIGSIQTSDPKLSRLYAGVAPMGEVAWKELGNQLYSLGFTSLEGDAGSAFARASTKLPPSSPGSLEDLFTRAGLVNAFVDFRHPGAGGRWLHDRIVGRLIGHVEMRDDWTQVVDGIVFLHTMQRSRKSD